jgi:hypothetical protein
MKVEEFITNKEVEKGYLLADTTEDLKNLVDILKEFAELKCKELLEIVAEKAKIKEVNYEDEMEWVNYTIVDKDSILNAVDLKEFIK